MAVELLNELPNVSWTKNPMRLEFQSDLAIEQEGKQYVGFLSFTDEFYNVVLPPVVGSVLSMQMYDTTISFTFVVVPELGRNELPIYVSGQSMSVYFASLVTHLRSNNFLNTYYNISVSTVIETGSGFDYRIGDIDQYIKFESKEYSDKANIDFFEVSYNIIHALMSTGSSMLYRKNLRIYAELCVGVDSELRKLISTSLPTSQSGKAVWDISIPLHNYVDLSIQDKTSFAGITNYYLNYFEIYGNNQTVGNYQRTANKFAVWGGVPLSRIGESVVDSLVSNGSVKWLIPRDRLCNTVVRGQEYELTLLNPASMLEWVWVCAKLTYVDDITIEVPLYSEFIWPTSKRFVNAMHPAIFSHSDDELVRWEIYIKKDDVIVSERCVFELDKSVNPYLRFVKYRNSYGSYSYVNLHGKGSHSYDITKDTVEVLSADSQSDLMDIGIKLRNKEVLRTGYKSKSEIEEMRDFYLSNEKYLQVNGTWMPIVVGTNTILESEDGNHLYAMQMEIQWAIEEQVWGHN